MSECLQRATSATRNEQILRRVTSDLQQVTSNEWISTSNEQRVKSWAWVNKAIYRKYLGIYLPVAAEMQISSVSEAFWIKMYVAQTRDQWNLI